MGIGASAGGIEALEQFLRPLPPESGIAFVIVTHLAPGRESALVPIMARFNAMPVVPAADGMILLPNRIHVLSREGILTIEAGRLRLREPDLVRRERQPIDVFFASLAIDRGERCAGVVLSGGGSDGSLGIKAIKEHGGFTLAQGSDHTEPRHPSMPESAIATGLVDLVLPVQDIPAKLLEYFQSLEAQESQNADQSWHREVAEIRARICQILRHQIGHDFSGYKEKTFLRRVRRRIQVLQLGDMDRYVEHLAEDPGEGRLLFRDLLISVTNFFRDADAFETLENQVIPRLLDGRGADETVRVWVPGCATGEEVYSLAMLLREGMDRLSVAPRIQVFATDIDERALAVARAARYPASLLDGVTPARLKRFFIADSASYAVVKEVRDLCIFSSHSVIRDPPFSRIDLISCRNLLIYLGADLQGRVIPILHYALRPGGFLFLGTSENITQHGDLFVPLTKQQRLFQRRDPPAAQIHYPLFPLSRPLDGHANSSSLDSARSPGRLPSLDGQPLRHAIERRVVERFSPAYVVVDREGEIVHYSARTGKYLEPAAGVPSRNLTAMARKGLRLEIRRALREALETRRPVRCEDLSVEQGDGFQAVTIIVEPLPQSDAGGDLLFLVVFEDVGHAFHREPGEDGSFEREDGTVDHLESELRETRERLQSSIEEYETAVEELKSANEELVSVNEELQSTNEELETAKEEQQSVNEELHTINAELGAKLDELDRANSDLKNLFESTQIATVFLDRHLLIRSFTPAVTSIFNLIPSDRGRPLVDMAHRLEAIDLRADMGRVLATLEPMERRVVKRGGGNYLMRLFPYRTPDNVVDGVLATFIDITSVVAVEEHQLVLSAELDHRIRVVLEMAAALVARSDPQERSSEAVADRLLDRLETLAEICGHVSRESWTRMPLSHLVTTQLESFLANGRASVDGPPVWLASKGALIIGMALRELAETAARRGALSVPAGRVSVSWDLQEQGGSTPRLRPMLVRDGRAADVAGRPRPRPGAIPEADEGGARRRCNGRARC